MALASGDETDLILPLLRGVHENPPFSTFLGRLQRRLGTEFAALHLRHGETAAGVYRTCDATAVPDRARSAGTAGGNEPTAIAKMFDLDRSHLESLRAGRVYTISELVEHDPIARAARRQAMSSLGLADERVVRLNLGEASGLAAWLGIARKMQRCSAGDGAMLSSLAPYLAEALGLRADLLRETTQARIAQTTLAYARRGWMVFDRDARLVDIDPATARYWEAHCGASPRLGERLLDLSLATERTLAKLAQEMPLDGAESHALRLREDPAIEALLLPYEATLGTREQEAGTGAVLALFPLPGPLSPQASVRLGEIHGLPPREAQLALELARGDSIAQAAQRLGLTLETTRNYSKRIYARLGVSGQPQLVQRIHEGAALLA